MFNAAFCVSCSSPNKTGGHLKAGEHDWSAMIRPAAIADESVIRDYIVMMTPGVIHRRYRASAKSDSMAEMRMKSFRNDPPDGDHHLELLLIMPCGRLAGVCHAQLMSDGSHEIGMSVALWLQGRGAGQALLRSMIEHARVSGHVRTLYVSTEPDNRAMREVAKKCGFVNERLADGEIVSTLELFAS